jgi:UDP-glucose 4-epimerase
LRDWTDVRDVARALDQAANLASDKAPVLNLATGVATPVREIASTVALHWGGVDAAARVSFSGRSRPGDPFSLVANIDRMRSQGIECPIPLTKGIAEYVAWYRTQAGATS